MALYAIGDLHLSLNSNKSMEVFALISDKRSSFGFSL